jgi:hypothetical protein
MKDKFTFLLSALLLDSNIRSSENQKRWTSMLSLNIIILVLFFFDSRKKTLQQYT